MAKRRTTTPKHPKLPNGFGRITEIKNRNLRNPFRAMVTTDRTEEGMPVGRILGYYPSWYAAYDALTEYHKNPYELKKEVLTIEGLYDKWSKSYFKELTDASSIRTVESAWAYVTPTIRRQNAASIQPQALKDFINMDAQKKDDSGKVTAASDNTKSRIKSMFNLMYDYAVLAGLVSVNPARQFSLKGIQGKIEKTRKDKNPFTRGQEQMLWNNLDHECTRMILINIYSGWRPEEMLKLEKRNVDLDKMIMVGGMKTAAGTDRLVPIHPKILPLIKYYYDRSCSDLVFFDYKKPSEHMTYDKYRGRFKKVMSAHNWTDFSPSCPRHTFSTWAKEARMDDMARKLIMGHELDDVTNKHYTHLDLQKYLSEEIIKI